ncbi:MAG TPA: hypothetical protein PK413_11070, partial [Thermoanaerobaculia bacterium]|nr:hypothetical protein [Thermoanaerobaculia bacterium]
VLLWGLANGFVHDWWFKRKRLGVTREDFFSAFSEPGLTEVAEVVYDDISNSSLARPLPVLPGDSLAEVYGYVDEDHVDLVEGLADTCGRARPTPEAAFEAKTVADVVHLIASLPPAEAEPEKRSWRFWRKG